MAKHEGATLKGSAYGRGIGKFIFRFVSVLAAFALPGTASAQEADPLPAVFHHDFRNQPLPGDLRLWNVPNPDYLQFQPEGLLIKVPKTFIIKRGNGVGVQTAFGLKGDFEITLAFDNLKIEAPGSEVGVGLAIDMTAQNGSNVKLSRVLFPEANRHAIRANFWHDKKEDYKVTLAPETAGRLRLQRTGATLTYFWATGTEGDNFKKVFQCQLGNSDIKFVRLDVYTGGIPRDVEVRLLDLRIRAQKEGNPRLTVLPTAPKSQPKEPVNEAPEQKLAEAPNTIEKSPIAPANEKPPTPKAATSTDEENASVPVAADRSAFWLLGVLFAGLALIGGLLVWLRRRSVDTKKEPRAQRGPKRPQIRASPRGKSEQTPSNKIEPAAETIYFQCSGCAKKLRAKAKLQDKTIKCPHCDQLVQVPQKGTRSGTVQE